MRFPLVAFCPLVLLLACGDESNIIDSSGLSTSDTKEVESIYDLGACTNKRKGEVVFVTDDDKEYICYSNKWIPSDEIDKSDEISSSSEDAIVEDEKSSSSKKEESSSSENSISENEKSSSSETLLEESSSSGIESSSSKEEPDESSSSSSIQEEKSSSSAESLSELTDSTFTDSRDGQTYRILKLGKQVWFGENLNYSGEDAVGYCHENDPEKCEIYGKLYRWNDAMKACPEGWHLPGLLEWIDLINYVGGQEMAGVKLKSKAYWYIQEEFAQYAGTDDYGFSILPGSFMSEQGSFGSTARLAAHLWTSTEETDTRSNDVFLMHSMGKVVLEGSSRDVGMSVRCLKDSD